MTNETTNKEYEPFGEEWKSFMLKLPKTQLIEFLKTALIKVQKLESEKKK
jgi:hypothetical protein